MADQMKRHQGEAFKEQSRMHHAYVVASLTSTRGEESQKLSRAQEPSRNKKEHARCTTDGPSNHSSDKHNAA